MRKCINGRLEINFSLVEFPAIRESLKKRNLLINVRTTNITVIQPLYAISRRGVVFVQKIIQSCNITVKFVELVNKQRQKPIFGIPHNFTNWLALLLQVDSLERPSFT
jgi:hypothetical protein